MRELLIVAVAASLSLSWASAAWASKHRCLRDVISIEGGADVSSKLARESAISAWRRHVSATHGESYAIWTLAQDARVTCDKSRRLTGHCVAHGIPCKDRFLRED